MRFWLLFVAIAITLLSGILVGKAAQKVIKMAYIVDVNFGD